MRGYSLMLLDKIKAARPKRGAKLGMAAVKANVPVIDIAQHMEVSRTAIYDWFTGRYDLDNAAFEKLAKFLAKAEAKTQAKTAKA